MLHLSALRGFIPARLIHDTQNLIPLPGDELKQFRFWHEQNPKDNFFIWCGVNLRVLASFMPMLSSWSFALDVFHAHCDVEREMRINGFINNDLWRFMPRSELDAIKNSSQPSL